MVHPTIEYNTELEINELSSPVRNLKLILLSERSQTEKTPYYMISIIWHSGKGKTVETVKMINSHWGWQLRGRDEYVERRGFLGQWKYSVWYYKHRYIVISHLSKPKFFFYILVSDVDKRGGLCILGDKEYMQISVHLSFFLARSRFINIVFL